jgi:hypothetical protein
VIGSDLVAEGEKLCMSVVQEFPQTTFFSGKTVVVVPARVS